MHSHSDKKTRESNRGETKKKRRGCASRQKQRHRIVILTHAGLQENPYSLPTPPNSPGNTIHWLQFSEVLCRSSSRSGRRRGLIHDLETLGGSIAKDRAH